MTMTATGDAFARSRATATTSPPMAMAAGSTYGSHGRAAVASTVAEALVRSPEVVLAGLEGGRQLARVAGALLEPRALGGQVRFGCVGGDASLLVEPVRRAPGSAGGRARGCG